MEWKVNKGLSTLYSEPYYKSLSIAFVSPSGAWNETKPGTTLFLSNIMSRCSRNYNEEAVAEVIDGNGASLVYAVRRDMTVLGVRSPPENMDKVIPVFRDLLLNPSFRKRVVKTEQQLLMEDVQRRENSPNQKHSIETINNAFRGTSLENPTLPGLSDIKSIYYTDLKERHEKIMSGFHWMPIVVGPEEHVRNIEIEDLIDKLNGQLINSGFRDPLPAETPRPMPFKFVPHRLAKQTYLSITVLGPREKDLKTIVSFLLGASMIDGQADSLLYKRLREDKGLTYYTYSYVRTFAPHSLLIIDTVTSPQKAEEVIKESFESLIDFADGKIEESNIEAHKSIVKTQTYSSTETTKGMTLFLASRLRKSGQQITPQNVVNTLDEITMDDVIRVFRSYFKRKNVATTLTAHPKTNPRELQSIVLDSISSIR